MSAQAIGSALVSKKLGEGKGEKAKQYFSMLIYLVIILGIILTRIQIEDSILKYNPTLIFVEHDETFIEKVATKVIRIEK